jgi:hypothetical protein
MKMIRCWLVAIALAAALSGLSLQGMGSVANAASSQHSSTASVVGQLGSSYRPRPEGPCPWGGNDC